MDEGIIFTIKGLLPTFNDFVDDARTHWAKSAKEIREAKDFVRLQLRSFKLNKTDKPVEVYFTHYMGTRHDPDNINSGARKIILDCLVKEGILKNDNLTYIKAFHEYFFKTDKNEDRVEVELWEAV